MTVPAQRKSQNIYLSIKKWIDDNFRAPNSYAIGYNDEKFDDITFEQWAVIHVLSHGAGRKGFTMVQVDLFSRARGKGPNSDRFGKRVAEMVDKLHAAMHVDSIPVYDWSNPTLPVLIERQRILVQNSGGTLREPEDDVHHGFDDGVAWRSLTYRFRLLTDASRAPAYYD